jgi:hypothetical protein
MRTGSPITDAVYGRGRGGPKKPPKSQRRPVESLVGSLLGEGQVADLYRKLGMKPPEQRRKRGRR